MSDHRLPEPDEKVYLFLSDLDGLDIDIPIRRVSGPLTTRILTALTTASVVVGLVIFGAASLVY